jgi:hypothetical protein
MDPNIKKRARGPYELSVEHWNQRAAVNIASKRFFDLLQALFLFGANPEW